MRRYVAELTGLCLAAGIAVTWVEAAGQPPRAVLGRAPLPVSPVALLPRPDAAALTTRILTRPLFSPSRRPYVAAHPAEGAEAKTSPAVEEPTGMLMGTAIGPTLRLALFRRSGSGAMVSLTIGDTLERWVITEIHLGSVTLHADTGEERIVPIEISRGVAPPIKLQLPAFHHEV